MKQSFLGFLDSVTHSLTFLFVIDRLWKLAVVVHFFRRNPLSQPQTWPSVTILQPITRGTHDLIHSLRKRATLDYPGDIQHLLICDSKDTESQNTVNTFLNEFPTLHAELLFVETPGAEIAPKIRKLQTAVPYATGEILCFMDDDVAPRPHTLRMLVPFLNQPGVGAAFGLPYYSNWHNTWSTLMSGLVNANMPLSFIALSYLNDPFRITGHIVLFPRDTFEKVGGLNGLEQHIDDDFELARRLRSHGLRSIQTPLVYDIDDALNTLTSYNTQLKRWFVLPRQAMMPYLSTKERLIAFITSCTMPIPGIVALLAFLTRSRASFSSLTACLGTFSIVYMLCERLFLKGQTPLVRWPLLLLGAIITPLHIIIALLSNNEIEWRGQRMYIHRNGKMEPIQ